MKEKRRTARDTEETGERAAKKEMEKRKKQKIKGGGMGKGEEEDRKYRMKGTRRRIRKM